MDFNELLYHTLTYCYHYCN